VQVPPRSTPLEVNFILRGEDGAFYEASRRLPYVPAVAESIAVHGKDCSFEVVDVLWNFLAG
jgi:hypothetical protein